jgi:hypothetical protein
MDVTMATLTYPLRPHASRAEQELISYLEGLRQESRIAKEDTDLQDADATMDAVRGTQSPSPRGYPAFRLNLLADQVQRKTGLYTDARPVLEVVSGNPTQKDRCELLTKCLMAVWDETTWQEQLARGLALGLQLGCNVGMMAWDPVADHGRGDLRPRFYDPRAVWIDPAVTAATQLEQAEFVCTEEVRALGSLIEQFGPRAENVKPDGAVSSYPERPSSERGVRSPAFTEQGRRRRRGQRSTPGQVPRAYCRHYWFKDWPRGSDGKPQRYTRVGVDGQGQPLLKATRRQIRHVVVAGGAVLVDEPNPYWHQMYPIEVLDWGVESDHLWGTSEIKHLRSAQSAIERLASQMLRNATLMNNFKVVADMNALDPDQWDSLTNRPAIILRKRPNTQLAFESPPSLPPYLFTLMQFLVQAMDLISGMNDAAKGSGSPSQSGVAVESLQIAAQTVIRLQARRLEAFIERLFQKAIACIYQYFTGDRVLKIFGPGLEVTTHIFDRAVLTFGLDGASIQEAFRDYTLSIRPGSSLNATRVQKGVLAGNLYQMQLIPGVDVLKQVEWSNPEETIVEARKDMIARTQVMMAAQAMGGAQQPQGNLSRSARGQSASRQPASFPANAR